MWAKIKALCATLYENQRAIFEWQCGITQSRMIVEDYRWREFRRKLGI